jgi:endonuclease/exonuclease/phosphatase family metal-dependent hydrolase
MLRILSFNIHKGMGWRTRRSTLEQIHTQLQLLHPDIIMLQEIRGHQFEALAQSFWRHITYGKNAVYTKGHHGNAILSNYPILFSENIDISTNSFEKRGLLHAIVHVSSQQPLHLLCVHLGLFKRDRKRQLARIEKFIRAKIPSDAPLILGGDFNDWSDLATGPLIEILNLREAFLDYHGTYAMTFPAWAPILKLDRIYYRGFDIHHAYRIIQKPWQLLSDHIALEAHLQFKTVADLR